MIDDPHAAAIPFGKRTKRPHDMCPIMSYCKRCGISAVNVAETGIGCARGDNVIGISHLVRAKLLAEKLGMKVDDPRHFNFTDEIAERYLEEKYRRMKDGNHNRGDEPA